MSKCPDCPQVSASGSVLRSEILGSVKLKVVLSGMPELRLGLNDKVLFEITGSEYMIYTVLPAVSCTPTHSTQVNTVPPPHAPVVT